MMQIRSTGMVSTHGRGMAELEKALRVNWKPPVDVNSPDSPSDVPAFRVSKKTMKDRETLKGMRRADRLSKMATLAASDAWRNAGPLQLPPERVGVVLATGLGPHVRTFKFLDGILDYGDGFASPTDFSHSVHNAAVGYITSQLQINGPVQTVTDFDFAFQQALRIAGCWLREKRCDALLAGTAEEIGDVMLHCCDRLLGISRHQKPKSLSFSNSTRKVIPGEGAAFFLLTRPEEGTENVCIDIDSQSSGNPDVAILDAAGLSGPEAGYLQMADNGEYIANYTPAFGSMMTGSAFQCAVAAEMLGKQTYYPNPIAESEHELNLIPPLHEAGCHHIRCLKRSKDGRWEAVNLVKGNQT